MSGEVTARERTHIKVCQDTECITETADPGLRCRNLDHLLDWVEAEAVQRATQRLLDMHMDTVLTHGAAVGQGLALAIAALSKPHEDCLSPDAAGQCPHTVDG